MFHTQGNTQIYSPFGSYVVEQHEPVSLKRFIEDRTRPDPGADNDHRSENDFEVRQAA